MTMRINKLGRSNLEISHLSLGGAAFSNIYGSFDEERCMSLITEANKCGINYVETGPWYGQGTSERTIGKALKKLGRNSYFVGSKVGRYEKETNRMFDFSSEKTEFGVDNTLSLLEVDYVDLIQIHDLTFAPDMAVILKETLPTLQKAVDQGKARYIGLADYNIDLMKDIVEESEVNISSILSYAKCTLFDNSIQKYVSFFKSKGIGVINAAATGMGLLTNSGPQSWHPADDETKAICRMAAEYCKSQNVELARLATWFSLNQENIDTNICGFFNVEQLRDTIDVMENGLNIKEKTVLQELQTRFFNGVNLNWDNVELLQYKAELNKLSDQKACS